MNKADPAAKKRIQADLSRLKPYGDTMNDGKVQLSFTLPVPDDEKGQEEIGRAHV